MEKRKLDIEVFSAWNSYAISMMSVLENCGMWKETDSFQKFMSVTGIASQFLRGCKLQRIADYGLRLVGCSYAFYGQYWHSDKEILCFAERMSCIRQNRKKQ